MTETTIALITGGNRGLGRASALHLAAAGADVILTYRSNPEEAAEVVADVQHAGRRAVALRLDTAHPGDFPAFADDVAKALHETWGRETFDVLVNNAGAVAPTPIGATERAALEQMVAVHFTGVVLLTQELLPLLADGGRLVNTSTGLARFTGDPSLSVYAAVKGAVEVWTRYLAKAVGARGITANVIAPGPVGTEFGGGYLRDDEDARRALAGNAALGRVGEPDDIGAAVAALAVGGLGWVTGQRLEASGGTFL
ncbi:MAG: Reductase [uncultured Nocardioidaceae bacterium]|uniref:Reductase n=1 Tax=uncultured Nocardioidaceae bacterium TaxID=253824 RepID=A0A6J4M1H5_9ACTN|nr:MAG: Reductase [uncultured Nocardioidaceae bacterium]